MRVRALNILVLIMALMAALIVAGCAGPSKPALPIIGEDVRHVVTDFCVGDANRKRFCISELRGKIYLVTTFHLNCQAIRQHSSLKMICDSFREEPQFAILSIDVNSDDTGKLGHYSDSLASRYPNGKWNFVVLNVDTAEPLLKKEFFMTVARDPDDTTASSFLHDYYFALVDRKGRVRGFYDYSYRTWDSGMLVRSEVIRDVRRLLAEQ